MQHTFLPNIQTRITGEAFRLGWWIDRERKSGQKIKHHENRSIRSEIHEHTFLRREVRSTYLDTGIRKNGTCNSTKDGYQKAFPVQAVKANGVWVGVEALTVALVLQPISWSVVSLTPWLLYCREESSRYPPNRRLSGPQRQHRRLEKGRPLAPPGYWITISRSPHRGRHAKNPPPSPRGSFRSFWSVILWHSHVSQNWLNTYENY